MIVGAVFRAPGSPTVGGVAIGNEKISTAIPSADSRKVSCQLLSKECALKVKRLTMIRNGHKHIPYPALKTKTEITKYIN